MEEQLGIAGSGAIARGLALTAARHGDVLLWARSTSSAERTRAHLEEAGGKPGAADVRSRVRVCTRLQDLSAASFVVEAVVEEHGTKAALLAELDRHLEPAAILATTTSSLAVRELAGASGRPDRFAALHVFNPVPRMELVELAFAPEASKSTRARAHAVCAALGKTAVEVPDVPGFVVNRLLFPFLFSAVSLQQETGMTAVEIDRCLTLGAGHPMGPLALLDFVGLDVAVAIGEAIGAPVPARLRALVAEGALGRKAGRGLHTYA